MGTLDGRVAIITGASKGIGRTMSLHFAREGAQVVCAARSRALLEETASLVENAGGRAIAVVADVATEDGAERVVRGGTAAFGRIDALINNAGDGGPVKPVQDYPSDEWTYTINSSLTSSYLMTRFAVPEMIVAGGGAIVNISSTAARHGLPFRIGYCSAKGGLISMTYGLALELGPHNIRVNVIAPGGVEGDRINRVIEAQAAAASLSRAEMRKKFVDRSPLGRMSMPDDIAALAVFLCSEGARNITGQCMTVGEAAS